MSFLGNCIMIILQNIIKIYSNLVKLNLVKKGNYNILIDLDHLKIGCMILIGHMFFGHPGDLLFPGITILQLIVD